MDPSKVRVVDVFDTYGDAFAANIRQGLRKAGINGNLSENKIRGTITPKPASATMTAESMNDGSGGSCVGGNASHSGRALVVSHGSSGELRSNGSESGAATSVGPARLLSWDCPSGAQVQQGGADGITATMSGTEKASPSRNCVAPHQRGLRSTKGSASGIVAVFTEEPVTPASLALTEQRYKKSYYGTISYIPATFGLYISSHIIREVLGTPLQQLLSAPESLLKPHKNAAAGAETAAANRRKSNSDGRKRAAGDQRSKGQQHSVDSRGGGEKMAEGINCTGTRELPQKAHPLPPPPPTIQQQASSSPRTATLAEAVDLGGGFVGEGI